MVQPTIIANMGEGNVGKTSSILVLYAKLRKAEGTDPQDILIDEKKDICEVIKINEINVGISSFGDTRQTVKERLDVLKGKGCQIIVTACRNNHDSVVLLNEYKNKYKYRIWRTSNARIYENGTNPRVAPKGIQTRFNENWAEEIANLIEAWCYAGKEKKNTNIN